MSSQPSDYTQAETGFIAVSDVVVDREARQRRTLGKDVSELAEQIRAAGRLIHPIVLKAGNVLVAGERRLEAHKKLGWEKIEFRRFESLPYHEAYKLELLENVARRQLSWQDEVTSVAKYHKMRQQMVGEEVWTLLGTATELSMSQSTIQRYLYVYDELSDDDVFGATTFEGAFNFLKGRAERARAAAANRGLSIAANMPLISVASTAEEKGAALSAMLRGDLDAAATPAADADLALLDAGKVAEASLAAAAELEPEMENTVITADFVEWVTTYEGPQFDVLHLDFPYGKNYAGSNTRKTRAHIAPAYADSPDVYWELLEAFITWQDRLVYPIAHMIFWFDMVHYAGTVATLTNAGWTLAQPHPLIWHKPYQGNAADSKRRPRHTYETALLLSRGDRKLVRLDQDVFVGRVDEKLHMNQKDHAMLRHFLSLVVDEHTALFDPTCGSGSALAAAKSLGASRILGVELDATNAEVARFVVRRGSEVKKPPENSAEAGAETEESND